MNKETLRMQMLSGVITESEYIAAINQEVENAEKDSLNEHYVAGGIVGIGAINQIPSRAKADYEDAFEYFLSQKYSLNEVEGDVMVDSMTLASYIDELISLADDMEYTPDIVKGLQDLKAGLPSGKMSVENALNVIKQTIEITEDDIDAVEALGQAVDYDDAIVAKAREISGLGEGKEVKESYLNEAEPPTKEEIAAFEAAVEQLMDMTGMSLEDATMAIGRAANAKTK